MFEAHFRKRLIAMQCLKHRRRYSNEQHHVADGENTCTDWVIHRCNRYPLAGVFSCSFGSERLGWRGCGPATVVQACAGRCVDCNHDAPQPPRPRCVSALCNQSLTAVIQKTIIAPVFNCLKFLSTKAVPQMTSVDFWTTSDATTSRGVRLMFKLKYVHTRTE